MKKIANLTYESSIDKLTEVNSSFDSGVLKIAYTNENRNKSYISKQSFEKALPSIYNCPIVCNYIRDDNDFGGHDIELVSDSDGNMRIVNVTMPCGVIPESSNTYWIEEDGHEYLCAEVLIWKRQEAYQRIKDGGITSESMEITIKDGHKDSSTGFYVIDDFEFTAFCLLGDNVTPCFEGASLEVFSKSELKEQIEQMMNEFKTYCCQHSDGVDNIHPQKILTEGGNTVLNENEFEVQAEEPVIQNEPENQPAVEPAEEPVAEPVEAPIEEPTAESEFALLGNVMEQLHASLGAEKVSTEWGEMSRYCFADCDLDEKKVYCWDENDWLLYGFDFNFDGDKVVIDYESKKRMKYIITEFDEGEQASPFAEAFEMLTNKVTEMSELEQKYQAASDTIESMETELNELREFKVATENAIAANDREKVLEEFSDLNGVDAFEELKENAADYDITSLEEKCFAIRGRNVKVAKFSLENNKAPKIKITNDAENDDEPYGGIFKEYNI